MALSHLQYLGFALILLLFSWPPKPHELIRQIVIHGPKPCELIGEIANHHGPKPYEFIGEAAQHPGHKILDIT